MSDKFTERGRWRYLPSIHSDIYKDVSWVGSQRQEPGTPLRSPMWAAGVQVRGPSLVAFLGAIAGRWIESEMALNQCSPGMMVT